MKVHEHLFHEAISHTWDEPDTYKGYIAYLQALEEHFQIINKSNIKYSEKVKKYNKEKNHQDKHTRGRSYLLKSRLSYSIVLL